MIDVRWSRGWMVSGACGALALVWPELGWAQDAQASPAAVIDSGDTAGTSALVAYDRQASPLFYGAPSEPRTPGTIMQSHDPLRSRCCGFLSVQLGVGPDRAAIGSLNGPGWKPELTRIRPMVPHSHQVHVLQPMFAAITRR
jgi:hypothetical protein